MKDLLNLLDTVAGLPENEPYVLATVVRIAGSAYRAPGARMLVTAGGDTVGSISGGCLERDVQEQALELMDGDRTRLLTYDATTDEDLFMGTGLGCNGIVQILLEKLPWPEAPDLAAYLSACIEGQRPGVAATVFAVEGDAGVAAGQRLVLQADGSAAGDLHAADLRPQVEKEMRQLQRQIQEQPSAMPQSRPQTFETATGTADILLEPTLPPVPLIVFGAGYDALPLVQLASELGWHISVVDHRPVLARPERFPQAHRVLHAHAEQAFEQLAISPRTVALVMTHNYLQDQALLKGLLPSPARYVGLLGPRQRAQRLLADLAKEGLQPTEAQLGRLSSPVGLDLGAETAEEIALSIIAEIQAVLAAREGGRLRQRTGPIHDRAG